MLKVCKDWGSEDVGMLPRNEKWLSQSHDDEMLVK